MPSGKSLPRGLGGFGSEEEWIDVPDRDISQEVPGASPHQIDRRKRHVP
jgi:hypothetical protein